jgi:hypothetical protein
VPCCLPTVNHISHSQAILLQRPHSFLSPPIMASSNDPFRTPQSTTPAFESDYVRVSDQSLLSPMYFLASFQPSHLCAPVFRFFSQFYIYFSPNCRSISVATPCESVGFVGYRNAYAHTQRSRRGFPGCIYHSRPWLCSESRIP